ncbi:hypothetical protein SAMN02745885_00505 [Carboxydocella sporoproducens DSM 16521]|uniref:Uncharacterized protein n=2 Tax=Carboxydocella TaxID=178898 RepID=A0A1T4MCR8_9FIRM|nr:hypothetical protein CFE_2098 [Carboxydocella thermautotrophica]AVX31695.1 hypothetical protein CTH_2131 [Carboxydocella thermautotrophica]SJZ64753.1 hypothetical protein SAMN02745885_00505 [Carboxydocella sporoproducens DSM 16521]
MIPAPVAVARNINAAVEGVHNMLGDWKRPLEELQERLEEMRVSL